MKSSMMGMAAAMAAFCVCALLPSTPVFAASGLPAHADATALSARQRAAVVAEIVHHWTPTIETSQGVSGGEWAFRMQPTFEQASDRNLIRAEGMATYQGMLGALTGQHRAAPQTRDALAVRSQPSDALASIDALGSTSADLVYTPVALCRIVDTRVAGGPIATATTRSFHGYTASNFSAQGGNASGTCGIPANPSALMIDVSSVASTAAGFLIVYPFGAPRPQPSIVHYGVGAYVSNVLAAPMTIGSATDEFSIYASGSTQVVVDVAGYFMAPQATALDTTEVSQQDTIGAATIFSVGLTCPTGYTITGGGCESDSDDGMLLIAGDAVHGFKQHCTYRNNGGSNESVTTYAWCARVPGR